MDDPDDRPRVVRRCTCQNDHVWLQDVRFAEATPRISGEAIALCPQCGVQATGQSEWRLRVGSKVFAIGFGVELHSIEADGTITNTPTERPPDVLLKQRELETFTQLMHHAEKYDEAGGYHLWSGKPILNEGEEEQCGRCTNGARIVATKFGGKVFGYQHDNNPTAVLGANEGGHDFAVVGEFIVDYWAAYYPGDGPAVLHLTYDADEVLRLYGRRDLWKEVPHA